MLTLIKREIEDHIAFFVTAIIASVILVFTILYMAYNFGNEETRVMSFSFGTPFAIFLVTGLYLMGGSQMYNDKNKKILAFLSTHPVTRNQIFFARIITGLLAILILLVPAAVAGQTLLNAYSRSLTYPIYPHYAAEIFSSLFLMALAVYCIGLQSGFHSNKMYHGIGMIFSFILLTLFLIKGFSPQLSVILLVFIAASLLFTWKQFLKAPLI